MKQKLALFSAIFLTLVTSTWAQMTYPPTLTDERTGQTISASTTKCIVLIHGWNPDDDANCYSGLEWSSLLTNLKDRLIGSGWGVVAYDWHTDAATGNIWDIFWNFEIVPASTAAFNADAHGVHLAGQLNQLAPNLREVHFIAHSAGSWAARAAAQQLLQLNPYVIVQVTLLDPFVPDPAGWLYGGDFSDSALNGMQFFSGFDRIQRLENYYADDSLGHGWNPATWGSLTTGPTYNTQETFSWRTGIDINQEIDWGNPVFGTSFSPNYDWHSGPIQFYADTIKASLFPNSVPSGLQGSSCPFNYTQIGWNRSLYAWESLLPQITVQPANKSVSAGGSATFSVTANQATAIAWYKVGGNWVGSGSTLTFNNVSPSDAGSYVAQLANSNGGQIFSQPASLTVGAAAAPSITTVSPSTLLTSSSQQPIKIIGTGFTGSSTLLFNGSIVSDPTRLTVVSANEIDYNIIVLSAGGWSVQVVNGSQTSNSKNFTVSTPPPSTGSLVVNLSPASIGAQWQVNGTYYNSGVPISLAPGQYTVSFKPVSGYTAPSSFPVNIVASAQTTTNATYTAVAPTTYTLTLNANSAQGSVSASPTASGNIYNAGSVVQLTAYANSGYHFTSWSGDASGTANTTTVTMNTAKNVTANFTSGDPNLATMTVTIKPDTAANAGVTWSVTGESQHLASGTSLSEEIGTGYTAYLPITLNLVSGWLGTNGTTSFSVPFTPGIVTNVTLTCVPDATPGLLTVIFSPPDAVTAGAHWHVNGGAAQGNGTTLSLSPGTNYSITFDSVSGWTAPTNRTVTITRAQTIVVAGNYSPPAGQPVIGGISPPIGPMTGGTLMTINGVNFTTPATVLIGGQSAPNVTVSSSTQMTCITPPNTNYGSAQIVVQSAGVNATNANGFAYGFANGNKISLLGSTGGSAYGVNVQGNYAYVGEGRNLLVLTNSSSLSKVGQIVLPGLVEGIDFFGQYAYVADGEGGVQVVDISNPNLPLIRGFYFSTNYTYATSIKISSGRAYVSDGLAGLDILDLGNPSMPTLLSSTQLGGAFAQDVVVKASTNGVFAYVATGSGVQVVDVSQPLSPVLRGQVSIGTVYSIAISGNCIYAATFSGYNDLKIVDISNADAPAVIGYAPSIPNTISLAAANNMLYAVSMNDGFGFYAFSISGGTLSVAGNLPHLNLYTPRSKMIVSGNQVYVADGENGLEIVNVSNPYSPSALTPFTDSGFYGSPSTVAVSGNFLCATYNGGFKVFDASNPRNPTPLGQLSTPGGGRVVARNGIAYVTANNNIDVINISIPSSPQILTNIPYTVLYDYGMTIVGSTLYLVGVNNNTANQPRFVAVDISNPSSPKILGTKDYTSLGNGQATSVAVSGNRAVVGISGGTNGELSVLDISNISAPVELGSLKNVSPLYLAQGVRISADGNYAYMIYYSNPSFLYVVNITDPSHPLIATTIPLDTSPAANLELQGSELYATTQQGLYVFDISNPASPVLTRAYSIFGIEWISVPSDSVSQSGNIYLADGAGGIVVLKEQDIQAPDIFITNPTFSSVYTNTTSTLNLGGGSDDNIGVTAIMWANNRGGSGQVSPPFDPSWYVSNIPLYPGTNLLTVTAFDAAGNSGSDILTVIYQTTNQNQSITFSTIPDHTFGDAPIPLVAAASSGLQVSFSVVSGSASISNNVLTLTGAGAVTVEADQSGNNLFNPATPVDVSFNVTRANQSIAFAPVPNHPASDPPFALTATTSSGLPVYFSILSGPAIINTNTITLVGSGTVTAVAYQPGNSNYNAAATVQQSFNVSQIPQTITFGALSSQKVGDAPFPLNASANSGLLVSFSVSGPATLSGNIVTLTGSGNVTVTASQPGNNSYAAATPVIQSFSVTPADNTLVGLGFQNNGGFQMAFYGMAGSNYTVQASSNLLNWQPFTNFIITNSPYNFADPTATNFKMRFYRATP